MYESVKPMLSELRKGTEITSVFFL